MSPVFDKTSTRIAAVADCTAQFVTELARAGRIPHIVASNGTRLFDASAAAIARQLKAEGLARRGWKKAA